MEESTPGEVPVGETCDPLGLILCVGPTAFPLPARVTVLSDGMAIDYDLHEGEFDSFGPFYQNITVPGFGNELPVVLCPNTCPLPIAPDVTVSGGVELIFDDVPGICKVVVLGAHAMELWPTCDSALIVPRSTDEDGNGEPDYDNDGNGMPDDIDSEIEDCQVYIDMAPEDRPLVFICRDPQTATKGQLVIEEWDGYALGVAGQVLYI